MIRWSPAATRQPVSHRTAGLQTRIVGKALGIQTLGAAARLPSITLLAENK
jgi:hypothetical protein